MNPLNNFMNRMDNLSQKVNPDTQIAQGRFKRHVLPRVGTVLVATPLEVLAVAQNTIRAPFEAVGAVLNLAVRAVSCFSGAECLKKAESKLPTVGDFIRTIARIVAYAIGAAFTLTLGFISPSANFRLHCALGLTVNKREEAIQAALLDEENKVLEEEAMSSAREAIRRQHDHVQRQTADVDAKAEAARRQERETAELQALRDLETAHTIENEAGDEDEDATLDAVSRLGQPEETEVDVVETTEAVEEPGASVGAQSSRRFNTVRKYTADPVLDISKSVVRFVTRGYFFGNKAAPAAA